MNKNITLVLVVAALALPTATNALEATVRKVKQDVDICYKEANVSAQYYLLSSLGQEGTQAVFDTLRAQYPDPNKMPKRLLKTSSHALSGAKSEIDAHNFAWKACWEDTIKPLK